MTNPKDSEFIFEQPHRSHVWRFQICEYNGKLRVSVWPWYKDGNGALQPCNAKFIRNGLQMPPERLWVLGEAKGPIRLQRRLDRPNWRCLVLALWLLIQAITGAAGNGRAFIQPLILKLAKVFCDADL